MHVRILFSFGRDTLYIILLVHALSFKMVCFKNPYKHITYIYKHHAHPHAQYDIIKFVSGK